MKYSLLAASLFSVITQAQAGAITYSGSNIGGPLGDFPISGDPPTSISLSDAQYHQQFFSVDTSGSYVMEVISANFDTVMILYLGAYDDSAPLANALAADDDGGVGLRSMINYDLTAGNTYGLVTRGFADSTGNFTTEISGRDNPLLIAEIAEPGTLALLGLGLLGLIQTRSRFDRP